MKVEHACLIQPCNTGYPVWLLFCTFGFANQTKRYLAGAVSNDAAAGHQTAPLFQVGGLPEGDSTTGPGARITCW